MILSFPFSHRFLPRCEDARSLAEVTKGRWGRWYQHGFSAAELLMTVAAFGVLAVAAGLSLGTLAPQFNVDNGTRMVVMALNQARVEAITRGHTVDVTFYTNTFAITDADSNPPAELLAEGQLPSGITLYADSNTSFTPLGTVASPVAVVLSNGHHKREVSIGLTGEVQVQ